MKAQELLIISNDLQKLQTRLLVLSRPAVR